MKTFISYSHKDEPYLEKLIVHLAQLKREQLIESWSDQEIHAGAALANTINESLQTSDLFIALLTPDYIASNYCYEKEFENAMAMERNNTLKIVPVIVRPCEWLNTPFKNFKALPKDGKAITLWQNEDTAFLDVTTQLRNLLSNKIEAKHLAADAIQSLPNSGMSSRLKIKKDFDTIQRIEFIENTFKRISDQLKKNLLEIKVVDTITTKILEESKELFKAIMVNRSKLLAESQLVFQIEDSSVMAYQQLQFNNVDILVSFFNK